MGRTGAKVLMQWVVAFLFIALVRRGGAVTLCNVDSNQLNYCLPAVRGGSPPPPTENCCGVVRQANLPCLCRYLSVLPVFGIDPISAVTLPSRCSLETPPDCHGKSPFNSLREFSLWFIRGLQGIAYTPAILWVSNRQLSFTAVTWALLVAVCLFLDV